MIEPGTSDDQTSRVGAKSIAGVWQTMLNHRAHISALAVRGLGVFAAFAVTYMLGRYYGAAATGQYALVTQTAMFLAVAGLFGLDMSVVRHFSKSVAEGRKIALPLLLKVLGVSLAMMALIVAFLQLGGEPLWRRIFGDVVARDVMLVLCLLVAVRGGVQLIGGLLRSQHRFALGVAVPSLFIPGAAAIALATGFANSVESALWASAVGGIAAVGLGLVALTAHVSRRPDALSIPMRSIMASSLPLWGASLAMVMGEWYGLAVAAQMLGASEAGLFRVGFQIAATLQIVSASLFAVYAAQISTAFHAGQRDRVARLAQSAVRLSSGLVLPLALVILLGGEFLLAQIGPEFEAALPILMILVVGQFAFALTGPCGLVLAMSGNERINLLISIVGIVFLLIALPLAAQQGGLKGLAICFSVVMLMRNLAAYFVVRYKIGIHIWSGRAMPLDKGIEA